MLLKLLNYDITITDVNTVDDDDDGSGFWLS